MGQSPDPAHRPIEGLQFVASPDVFRVTGSQAGREVTMIPLLREYKRPYIVYWDVLSEAQWAARLAEIRAEEAGGVLLVGHEPHLGALLGRLVAGRPLLTIPLKKAAVACDACGRFLCALCDCELNGRHYCPVCLEAGKRSENIRGLEEERFLYDRQAFVLAILPVFITGLAALYLTLRYWKAPGSLVSPSRWRMPAALTLGILQVLG